MKTALESRPQAYKRITNGIRQYMNHTVGVMKLVQEAKRLEIWKEKWDSWQDYCENEFGKTARRAYQLLEIASTIDEIQSVKRFHTESEENKGILTNLSTRQVKALSGLPTEKKAEVFHSAVAKSGGKSPKPETINGVRQEVEKPPEIRLDKVGRPIPEGILSDWDRAHEIGTKLRSMVSEVKCVLQKGLEGKTADAIFRELTNSIISDAEALHFSLSQMVPYAVCPKCQGKLNQQCLTCRQRGFISKFLWDSPVIGNDLRNVIKRQYADSQTLSA